MNIMYYDEKLVTPEKIKKVAENVHHILGEDDVTLFLPKTFYFEEKVDKTKLIAYRDIINAELANLEE